MYSKSSQTSRPVKKMSRTALNRKANRELAKLWTELDVHVCEVPGCNRMNLTNMHRYKRRWFYDKPDHYLWSHEYVAHVCMQHHRGLEFDKEGTEKLFEAIRST